MKLPSFLIQLSRIRLRFSVRTPSVDSINERLAFQLTNREIEVRCYRGSVLVLIWSMITPLMMLAIYTFVFATIFKSRWPPSESTESSAQFAVILFSGFIIYQIFAEILKRSPKLMLKNTNYVKKDLFPLEILVPVALGNTLFYAAISILILIPFIIFVMGLLSWTFILLPFILVPLLLVTAGVGWMLAPLGMFARKIVQFMSTLAIAHLFLAPVYFGLTALPALMQPWLALNPVTVPVEQARWLVIFGGLPDLGVMATYMLISIIICTYSYIWFQKTREAFADVL